MPHFIWAINPHECDMTKEIQCEHEQKFLFFWNFIFHSINMQAFFTDYRHIFHTWTRGNSQDYYELIPENCVTGTWLYVWELKIRFLQTSTDATFLMKGRESGGFGGRNAYSDFINLYKWQNTPYNKVGLVRLARHKHTHTHVHISQW